MKLNLGENIRTCRRKMDMTQEQLAQRLGVSFQSVSRWENGTTYPDMELLPVLAGVFGVTTDMLLGIPDEKVEEREKKSLLAINDNYKKVILTMDNVKNKQIDGIEVINIIDFLMN